MVFSLKPGPVLQEVLCNINWPSQQVLYGASLLLVFPQNRPKLSLRFADVIHVSYNRIQVVLVNID